MDWGLSFLWLRIKSSVVKVLDYSNFFNFFFLVFACNNAGNVWAKPVGFSDLPMENARVIVFGCVYAL